MDGLSGPTGFAATFQSFMYYAGPIAQVLFWLVVGIAAIWATLIFKRYVDFMTGGASPKAGSKTETVDVEKFVE